MRWRIAAPYLLLLVGCLVALGWTLLSLTPDPGSASQAVLVIVATVMVGGPATRILSGWQTSALLGPLAEVARMARWLGKGDLDHRIALADSGPLREVGDAMNQMAERLREQVGALTAERARHSAVLATMADGILIADSRGDVVLVNSAARDILRVPHGRGAGDTFIQVVRDHELAASLQAVLRGEANATEPRTYAIGSPPRYVRV